MVTESWDVYDRAGNKTGQTRGRDEKFRPDEYGLCASLWIARPDGKLLIQKRAPQKKYAPGKWSITGGVVRAGETSAQGCLREVAEEIGLELNPEDIEFLNRSFGEHVIFDDYAAACDLPLSAFTLQTEEVSEIRWAGIPEIRAMFEAGEFLFDDMSEMDMLAAYMKKRGFGDGKA